jgi:hypothetical protein
MVKEGFIENQLDSDTGFDSSIQQMRQCYLDAYAAGAASLQRANHAISDELATYKAMIDLYGTQQLEDAIAAALEANQQAKKP